MEEFIRNCRVCHKPMEQSPFTMCQTCLKESELVRRFSKKHPFVTIEEITQQTKVSSEKVKRLVELGDMDKKMTKKVNQG